MTKFYIYIISMTFSFTLIGCEELIEPNKNNNIINEIEGAWKCNETSALFLLKSTQGSYDVYISPSQTNSSMITISNFYQLGSNTEITAIVSGRSIKINSQFIDGNFTVRGNGTISQNHKSITWIYYVDDGSGQEDEVTATYTSNY